MDIKPNSHPQYNCQELSLELGLLQRKKINLFLDLESAQKSGWSNNLLENLAKIKPFFDEVQVLVFRAEDLKKNLNAYTLEELKMMEGFREAFEFQRKLFIDKGILTQEGKYTCQIPGKYFGQEFTLPEWRMVVERFSKAKLKEIKTLNEGIFTLFPLGLKMEEVAEKTIRKYGGGTGVSPTIHEENLYYFAESIKADASPVGTRSFEELMEETDGFLLSVMDGVKEMPAPKTVGNYIRKMQAHLEDCRRNAHSRQEGKFSVCFQQYLAGQIFSLMKDDLPLDNDHWTCAIGSYFSDFQVMPLASWYYDFVNLNFEFGGYSLNNWRARSSVII